MVGTLFAGPVAVLPRDNTRYGLVEFGTVLALYFTSALVSALRFRSVINAVLTSVVRAIIASLVWVIAVLLVYYAFRGSERQLLVLRAEGDYEDFAGSGLSDFNTFVMEDFMGAVFFHLLLGPCAAAVLGALGGWLGRTLARLRK